MYKREQKFSKYDWKHRIQGNKTRVSKTEPERKAEADSEGPWKQFQKGTPPSEKQPGKKTVR